MLTKSMDWATFWVICVTKSSVRCLNAERPNAECWNAEQRRNAEQRPNAECPECRIPG
jgi:hypothetical protein